MERGALVGQGTSALISWLGGHEAKSARQEFSPSGVGSPAWWETIDVGNTFESKAIQLPNHLETPDI